MAAPNTDALAAALATGAQSDPFLSDRAMVKVLLEAATPAIREQVARDIEASIVSEPAERYHRECRCLDGEKCHPHACHDAMNRVTARIQQAETEDGEGVWPVIQAGMFWDELDPVIRRDCAWIARNGPPPVVRADEPDLLTELPPRTCTCGELPHDERCPALDDR